MNIQEVQQDSCTNATPRLANILNYMSVSARTKLSAVTEIPVCTSPGARELVVGGCAVMMVSTLWILRALIALHG